MIAFRQLILPGDVGSDVLAVKRTLRRLDVVGSDSMTMTQKAGGAFVATLKRAQADAGLEIDGKYGRDTHDVIAPHFRPDDEAALRKCAHPPAATARSVWRRGSKCTEAAPVSGTG